MGMMLETTAERLFTEKGAPHFGSPDKDPKVRLQVLEDAGRSKVPFTTGILIGLGETREERVDAIFALQRVSREYNGIQEVIVQNFRAKPDTKMRDTPTPSWPTSPPPSRSPAWCSGRAPASRPRRTSSASSTSSSWTPGSTTGAVSPRSPRTT